MGGRQPLVNDGEDVWLVGNGEVYNHAEVRAGLDPEHTFVTDSDNEVALHLLEERGPLGLAELNGMFAFVMAADDGRFVAARDPVGIKPLYWAQRGERTRFASEMAAFDEEWQRARRAVSARLRLDAAGRADPLRPRRARRPGVDARPDDPRRRRPRRRPARHARRADRRRRAPAHGRRARRRVPLRRPGLEPRRGDRREGPRRARRAPADVRRRHRELARPRRRAPSSPSTSAPTTTRRRTPPRTRWTSCPSRCARSSPSIPRSCAARCPTTCSRSSPPSTSRSC